MRRPTVFLITGYARAGKDTLAEAMRDLMPSALVTSFADPLKSAVNRYFTDLGIERVNVKDTADKVRFRNLLVEAGRAARSVDVNVFADKVAYDARLALMSGRSVIVPDWRYVNEHSAIVRAVGHHHPIVTIRIGRVGCTAANQEEQDSIDGITERLRITHYRTFADGEVPVIRDWAADILSTIPDVPAA